MSGEILLLALSAVAGVVGTGIGGIIGAFVKDKNQQMTSGMLAFAAGIMLGVTSFEMIPEAVESCAIFDKNFFSALLIVVVLLVGVFCAYVLNLAVEKIGALRNNTRLDSLNSHVCSVGLQSVEILKARSKFNLKKAGIVTFLAIALHNIPEGMAIGASGAMSLKTGALVALIIALHNIPEGMAISAPLVGGGVRPAHAIMLAFLAGFSTVVGGIIGVLVGGVSELANSISIALAAGAMIYVACFDLLPISSKMRGEFGAFAFFAGLVAAMIFSLLF